MKLNIISLFAVLVLSIGCGGPTPITIVPTNAAGQTVDDARVIVNGTPAGQGTTNVLVDSKKAGLMGMGGLAGYNITVDGSPRYYGETFTIDANSPTPLVVSLREDEVYKLTVQDTNQVVNKWLILNINETAKVDSQWWTVIVNAIATQDFEMQMMDEKSGFIRTAWKERSFGNRGLRRRFTGNLVSKDPLSWRIKYNVEVTDNGQDWSPYDRGVKEELDALSEIRSRTQ